MYHYVLRVQMDWAYILLIATVLNLQAEILFIHISPILSRYLTVLLTQLFANHILLDVTGYILVTAYVRRVTGLILSAL